MDPDIELRINVNIFRLLCVVWILLCIAIAIPGYTLPVELKDLQGIITGSLLTVFTSFSKKVSGDSLVQPKEKETEE